jgi:hypothetical protein
MAKLLSGPSCGRLPHSGKQTSVGINLGCRSAAHRRTNAFTVGKAAAPSSWRTAVRVSAPRRARLDCMNQRKGQLQQQQQQQHVQKLARRKCSIAPPSGALQLTVLTFNVLADGLAQEGGFIRVRILFELNVPCSMCLCAMQENGVRVLTAVRWIAGTTTGSPVATPPRPVAYRNSVSRCRHRLPAGV